MLNFEIDPAIMSPLVPPGTVLDTIEGRHFVSVVGFRFLRTRLFGIPVPFHRDFEEVNLRFYVRRGEKRGVVFVRELVPRRAIAWLARRAFNENYASTPMRHQISDGVVSYSWRNRRRWDTLSTKTDLRPETPRAGSLEQFITEHYWGYVAGRDGRTLEYQVEHPPWRVSRALEARLDCDVAPLYGDVFVPALSRTPHSAFVAEGSAVIVRSGTRLLDRGASRP